MPQITIKHIKTLFGFRKINFVINDGLFFTLPKGDTLKTNITSDTINIKIGKNICVAEFTIKNSKDIKHIEMYTSAFNSGCVVVYKNGEKHTIPNTKYYQILIFCFILLLAFASK